MAGEDKYYRAFLLLQPCAVPGCRRPVEVHHSTVGDIVAPGEPRPPKTVGTRRGKGQVAHDYFGIPMCHAHHVEEFHALRGYFRDFKKADLRSWQTEQVALHRDRYDAQLGETGS